MLDWDWNRFLLAFAGNGRFAVIFFFVLSGYVLGLSLQRRDQSYREFLIQRVRRIWPAHLVVLALIAVLIVFSPMTQWQQALATPEMNLSKWFVPFSEEKLLANLFLIRYDGHINGVTWTLQWEMLAAFYLFPLAMIFSRVSVNVALVILIVLLGLDIAKDGMFNIFQYAYAFCGGMFLSYYCRNVRIVAATGIVAYIIGAGASLLPQDSNTSLHLVRLTETVCAAILVMWLAKSAPLSGKIGDWLSWLGERSYSFYLLHSIVLFLCGLGWVAIGIDWPDMPAQFALLAISVLCTMPLAQLLHKYVERPFMRSRSRSENKRLRFGHVS